MNRLIILDSSPAGLVTNPSQAPATLAITKWLADCEAKGNTVCLPEIIDYELRRELIRANKPRGIAKLDALKNACRYLPLTTPVMLRAAALWADSRQKGLATGDPKRLDIDVILAAQVLDLELPAGDFVVATSNVGHLSGFVPAERWENIAP